jgi:DMSO/TMAO reductase YedYZ molybdopterin-dependent catalytic subunit
MSPPFSRGFHRRHEAERVDADRVPPGQYVVNDYPVLSAGPTPHTPLDQWSFTVNGAVDEPRTWTWAFTIAFTDPRHSATPTASTSKNGMVVRRPIPDTWPAA